MSDLQRKIEEEKRRVTLAPRNPMSETGYILVAADDYEALLDIAEAAAKSEYATRRDAKAVARAIARFTATKSATSREQPRE